MVYRIYVEKKSGLDNEAKGLLSEAKNLLGIENLEVIMVNDGSTDESPAIMQKYACEYSNFKIINLENKSGAAGKPRNEGLKAATAPYIMFLDPDDIYDKRACEVMYNTITSKKCDIVNVLCDIINSYPKKCVI